MQTSYVFVLVVLVLTPGLDLLMVMRNTVTGGRRSGIATTLGISAASAAQGVLTSLGIGAMILQAQPIFQAIKWAGVAYLAWLGINSLRAAWNGSCEVRDRTGTETRHRSFRAGFLCNITNPKVFVFYLALLPQFVDHDAPLSSWLGHALLLPVIGTCWLVLVALGVDRSRTLMLRGPVRRTLDAASGLILLAFSGRLARET